MSFAIDLALSLLKTHPQLGVTEDINRNYAIKLLAHKPSAFMSGKSFVFWKGWIYYSCKYIVYIYTHKLSQSPFLFNTMPSVYKAY